MKFSYSLLILTFFFFSCSLDEGKGGKATCFGQVLVQQLYSNPILGIKDSVLAEYPAVDERVYITYGDNIIYDDDFRTDENGKYKFTNLTKGDYKISVFSYCDTCETEIKVLSKKINLKSHKETKEVSTFYIETK